MPPNDPFALPDAGHGAGRLGAYQLVRPISAGGMARVYEGRYESLASVVKRVAVKVIHPEYAADPQFQELFIAEARVSALLEHQHLVRIYHFDREGDLYYLVMEYIDGLTFRRILGLAQRFRRPIEADVVAELGRQVCDGLHYAHTLVGPDGQPLRLVHRDIKPSNLMLDVHGVAKVLDFGISYAGLAAEAAGQVKGTWGYMALEQTEGRPVGPAADVFGVAAVLYELAALQPLFPDKDNDVVRQRLLADHACQRAAALGGQWSELARVLVRALQRDAAARYGSTAQLSEQLSLLVPEPVVTRQRIARLVTELRELEAGADGANAGTGAPVPSASSMRPPPPAARAPVVAAGPPVRALPVRAGDVNGVGPRVRSRRAPPSATSGRSLGATVGAALLVLLALGVIGYAARALFLSPAPAARGTPVPAAVLPPIRTAAAPGPALRVEAQNAGGAASPAATPTAPPATTGAIAPSSAARASGVLSSPGSPDAPVPSPAAPLEPVEPAAPVRIAPQVAAAPVPAAEGHVTIGSDVRAQVLIDGRFIRIAPVFEEAVSAGAHNVVIVADDGRRKSFRIDVPAGGSVTRVWSFNQDQWGDL